MKVKEHIGPEESDYIYDRWSFFIKAIIGETGQITDIDGLSFFVTMSRNRHYNLPYFVLEKVEKPKPQFKPFDRVLVRDNDAAKWYPDIFLWYFPDVWPAAPYQCTHQPWAQCIPYEGNEHLAGTTDSPEE